MEAIPTRTDILQKLHDNRAALRRLGLARLSLFGSFVRDEGTSTSDVDFVAEFLEGRKSFDGYMAVINLLEDILGRRVDVVTRESLSPYIGPKILKEAQDVEI